jgi:DNA-binding transcriptional LysR family regulator
VGLYNYSEIEYPKVNPEHLITFYFVAEGKSLSQASERLFLSQPTVFLHIRTLERCFGVKLFYVKKKRVVLTEAGEALVPHAKEIYQQVKSAERCLENCKEAMLRIGVALTISPTITMIAGRFVELYPGIKVKIKEGPSYQIAKEISDLRYDLAVVARLNYTSPKLETVEISGGEKMVFVASPNDPLSRKGKLKLGNLNGYPLVLPSEQSASRETLLRKLNEQQIRPLVVAEMDNPEHVKHMVKIGKGIALLLEANVKEEVSHRELVVLPFKEDVRIGIDVLFHKDNPLSAAAKTFLSMVRETYKLQEGQLPPFREAAISPT